MVGKRFKAVWIFSLIMITLMVGVLVADFRYVGFYDNPFYYVGKFGSGLSWLVTEFITSDVPRGIISLKYSEVGLLYICTAGALNMVVLLMMLMAENKYFDDTSSGKELAADDVMVDGT